MRKELIFTKIIIKNIKKSIGFFSFLVLMLLLFNSLSLFSKSKNQYLYLATHRSKIPIFLEINQATPKARLGTKFAQKLIKGNLSKAKHKATEVDSNSTSKDSVISLIPKTGFFELKLAIKDKDRKIMITVYNLLAKKVLDVYNGDPKNPETPYILKTNTLSDGVYLCIIQGENFRLLKKFIVSR